MGIDHQSAPDRIVIHSLPPEIRVELDVRIRLRDGIWLSANVFRPNSDEPAPVVASYTRYGKDDPPSRYLRENSDIRRAAGLRLGDIAVSEATPWEGPDPAFWVTRGYALVIVDARGTGLSEGHDTGFQDVAEDYEEVISWAAGQPWCTGKVGLTGVSYLAITQYAVAARKPRGLYAISPWEGLTDSYRDLQYHGGIPETGFTGWWTAGDHSKLPGSDEPPEFSTQSSPTAKVAAIIPVINLADIDVPVLECASWSDQGLHARGSFNAYEGISSQHKWLFTHGRGKWHVYYNDADAADLQIAFFDRFLKGIEEALDGYPQVRLETRKTLADYNIRGADQWPPAEVRYLPFYLEAAHGRLDTDRPNAASVTYAATEAEKPAEFTMKFERDTEITGPASLKLAISTDSGTDIDLFVGIRKFNADGQEVHFEARENDHRGIVSNGWLRVSQRKIDPTLSTPQRPYLSHNGELPVTPGQIYEVQVEILPSSTLFEAGSRLVLSISGREIWSNRMCQHRLLRNTGNHTIHTGGEHPSHLLLPIIEP